MSNETEAEIIARNVAKWRKDKADREAGIKPVKKVYKKGNKWHKKEKTVRSQVKHSGLAFDALKESLEDAIEMSKRSSDGRV